MSLIAENSIHHPRITQSTRYLINLIFSYEDKKPMVSFITKLYWGGDPDDADQLSGLSKRDIYSIQKSWKPLYDDAGGYGVALFLRLFNGYPKTKQFFAKIRHLDDDTLRKNAFFKAHTINLMSSLNMAILNLHIPEVVVAMMNKLGFSHSKHKIQEKHFHNFVAVLVDFLTNDLQASPALLQSWGRFINFICPHIFETLSGNVDATIS